MDRDDTRGLSRRDLLRASFGVAIAAGCFSTLGLRQALAEARATGKPLLIEAELNRRIPLPQNRQAYLAAIDSAKRDLLGHLTANFHLTPAQIADVRSIPQEDLLQLNALLDRARANNLKITVRIMRGNPAGVPASNDVYLHIRSGQPSPPMARQETTKKMQAEAQQLQQEAEKAATEASGTGKWVSVSAR